MDTPSRRVRGCIRVAGGLCFVPAVRIRCAWINCGTLHYMLGFSLLTIGGFYLYKIY